MQVIVSQNIAHKYSTTEAFVEVAMAYEKIESWYDAWVKSNKAANIIEDDSIKMIAKEEHLLQPVYDTARRLEKKKEKQQKKIMRYLRTFYTEEQMDTYKEKEKEVFDAYKEEIWAEYREINGNLVEQYEVNHNKLSDAINISIFDYRGFIDVLHKAQELEEEALKPYTVLGKLSIGSNSPITFTDIAMAYRYVADEHKKFMQLLDGEFGAYSEPIFDEYFGSLLNAITIAKDISTKSGEW
jgi:hypothetical protein